MLSMNALNLQNKEKRFLNSFEKKIGNAKVSVEHNATVINAHKG